MAAVQLALYKGKGRIGNALIRAWTGSPYSHCELVVNGVAYSSSIRDGGVRAKPIEFDSQNWDFIDLPEEFGPRVRAYYGITVGQRYGWLDLLTGQVFNRAKDDPSAAFCSEWCAAALGLPNATIFSPRTLGDLVRALLSPPWRQQRSV